MAVALNDLIGSYYNAVNRLIPLISEGRQHLRKREHLPKIHLKIDDISGCFENSTEWIRQRTASGHSKFKHKVTRVVVEFQSHTGSRGDSTVNPSIQEQVLNQVQTHLNILCNDIFQYRFQNWGHVPDYNTSLINYNAWALRR